MKTLTLTEQERALLQDVLSTCLSDLRMEIADTDNSFFKQDLRERKAALNTLLEKVGEGAEVSA